MRLFPDGVLSWDVIERILNNYIDKEGHPLKAGHFTLFFVIPSRESGPHKQEIQSERYTKKTFKIIVGGHKEVNWDYFE